ncbi:Ubiquitin-activating enzyme, catalytic cysteine domain,THIF-type NAD/FAD binding fold,Ubiquitin-activating [Cinara cedri]|uniref:Ubiquitin-activating enzyme E1 n=1 Tax=Cinara cedri TaxID=506608 RepID=A0A5E4N3E0_9HEMI|nr:Ubiquitin-activating enzyme, catalytic cysteine domain,THIF-type NAD/FAD binding fold,Ubiquitin-activating [Cinara cedri]
MSGAEVLVTTCEFPAKKRKLTSGESSAVVSSDSMADKQVIMSKNGVNEFDGSFYSRQLYVLGHDAMRKMASSDVLISGLGGLGVEIAKNVILGGVKSVTLHDSVVCTYRDLSSQFYLSEEDIGKNRALVSYSKLAELNSYVPVKAYIGVLSDSFIKQFKVVVLTEATLDEQLRVSDITHPNGIALIIADTRGVFSQVFCDFGEDFVVTDSTGENPISVMVAGISKKEQGVVTCMEDFRHGFEDGDYVTFREVKGMTEINGCEPKKITVLGPYKFSIGDTTSYSDYIEGGIATQVKMPKKLNFKSLKDSLDEPEYLISDFGKFDRPTQLHLAFTALHKFVSANGRLPTPWSSEDANAFLKLTESVNTTSVELDVDLIKTFSNVCAGNINPMTSFIGGIVAQEVMKSCSGKFSPIFQWFYFDATETLPEKVTEEDAKPVGNRYDGQVAVYGQKFQTILGNLKYFVVGAGAIGCELLKNFAIMGVGCGNGKIIVTDMDLVKKSNLNTQFLFSNDDIQTSKSETAAKAIKQMNPNVNVDPHTNKVCHGIEPTYNDTFFDNLDGVALALDNVDARVYMDSRCIFHKKPLLESGTWGTKGNTQIVLPMLTESYNSSQDTKEKEFPICILHNFPYTIEHTLQWAKDSFKEMFTEVLGRDKQFIEYVNQNERTNHFPNIPAKTIDMARKLLKKAPKNFDDCIEWARLHFEDQFSNQIKQLLINFPPDETTSSGQPFWSGLKRCPKPISFDVNNMLHLDFIFAASNLKAEAYNINQIRDRIYIAKVVSLVKVPEFVPKSGIRIAENNTQVTVVSSIVNLNELNNTQEDLPPAASLKKFKIVPLEFEEDDDNNLHIDFILAASNIRAVNYEIQLASRDQAKLIGGKIIPAIVTTSSVVAGLACQEFIKLAWGFKELKKYKNGFINLALPFFGFSEPLTAPKSKYNDIEWTLWDRFEIEGELTLGEFINYFREKHALEITMLSEGYWLLYSSSMSDEKIKKRINTKISEILYNKSQYKIKPNVKSLALDICCTNFNGASVTVPFIKYNLPSDFKY